MSIKLMTAVWQSELPPLEKLVALALADNSNDSGHCWPSIAHIVQKTSLSERCTQEKIKNLIQLGWITRQIRNGKSNVFVMQPPPPHTAHPAHGTPPQDTHPTPAPHAPPPPHTAHPEPPIEPSRESPIKKPPAIVLPDWMPKDLWNEYLAMRKKKRATPTEGAIHILIAKLDNWRAKGHDPSAILSKSITSNWTDIFEPKGNNNENASRNITNGGHFGTPSKSERARAAILESAKELGYAD